MHEISIIVPVYNVDKYLNRCIESILSQTFTDFELILVDDGSTDNSGLICDKFKNTDNRIIVIHKENGGLSEARNAGLDICRGKYVSLIDGDDYIEPDMYEVLRERIQKDKTDICICGFKYVDVNGKDLAERNKDISIQEEIITKEDVWNRICSPKYWYYIISCNKLYKREIFDNVRFPKGKWHEDEFVAHYIFDNSERISCIEKALYNYVQRADSIMGKKFSVKNLDGAEAFLDRAKFFAEKGRYNNAASAMIRAVSVLSRAKKSIDPSDYVGCTKIKEKKKVYNEFFTKMITKKIPFAQKMRLLKHRIYI